MKLILSIMLQLCVLILSFQNLTLYGLFKLNQAYIIENLCVNKPLGDSCCAGHCQLTKVLEDKNTTEDQPTTLPTFELSKTQFIFSEPFQQENLFLAKRQLITFSIPFLDSSFQEDIFRPPAA